MPRKALATAIALAVGYTAGVVSGRIDEHRGIDSVTLIFIVLAVVVVTVIGWPELASRLKVVEISGFRLEMLEVVKRHISELKVGTSFDLAPSVEQTAFGWRQVDRLKDMEAGDGQAGNEEGP